MNNTWTREKVKEWIKDAARTERLLRGPRGPKEYGGCWPDHPPTLYPDEETRMRKGYATPDQITRYDEVCKWKTWVNSDEGDVIWVWATKRLRWKDMAFRYNRDKSTIIRWFNAGVTRIAAGLNKRKVG